MSDTAIPRTGAGTAAISDMIFTVLQIWEEDYGCEGIPEEEELMCRVLLMDENKREIWKRLPDRFLTAQNITVGSILEI